MHCFKQPEWIGVEDGVVLAKRVWRNVAGKVGEQVRRVPHAQYRVVLTDGVVVCVEAVGAVELLAAVLHRLQVRIGRRVGEHAAERVVVGGLAHRADRGRNGAHAALVVESVEHERRCPGQGGELNVAAVEQYAGSGALDDERAPVVCAVPGVCRGLGKRHRHGVTAVRRVVRRWRPSGA